MLKPYQAPQFIERIITSPAGEQYRVVFAVTFVAGQAKARVVSAEKIETISLRLEAPANVQSNFNAMLALPCSAKAVSQSIKHFAEHSFKVSPYTSLLFFVSQPTRAPSFA